MVGVLMDIAVIVSSQRCVVCGSGQETLFIYEYIYIYIIHK